ncbi:MAG TPA: DedA family protein [Ktedonobacterales bacterium]|nr:DedA family protein [Ktedonobacterales bacterium]
MAGVVQQALATMSQAPLPAVYLIALAWMLIEGAGIALPIEPVMLLAGSLAVPPGKANLFIAVASLAIGCLLGSSLAFLIGRRLGTAPLTRVGRYVGLTEQRVAHMALWLRHRGPFGILVLRAAPVVRTYSSFVMGEAEMSFKVFAIYTIIAEVIYSAVFVALGYVLGRNYEAPLAYMQRFGLIGVILVIGVALALWAGHRFGGSAFSWRALERRFQRHHAALAAQPVAARQA